MRVINHKEEICRFVNDFYRRNGYAPAIVEIGRAVGMSSRSAVQRQLRQLVDNGRIVYVGGKYIPAQMQNVTNVQMVPVLGTIAAGVPIEAIEELDGYVAFLPQSGQTDRVLFALRVRGESMI
ncbi:MAG: S24 family peptidase, partial [Ethanoligenens sp.]